MPYTKIFPVFDRDSKSNPEDIFNSAIRNPPSKKIKSLYTNPCFEYWLFLHLEDSQSLSCDKKGKKPNIGATAQVASMKDLAEFGLLICQNFLIKLQMHYINLKTLINIYPTRNCVKKN